MNDWAPAVRLLTRFRVEAAGQQGVAVGPWLPAVGAALGLAGWVVTVLCGWFGGPRAGVVLAAVGVFVFEAWVTAGRRYGATVRLLENLPENLGGSEAGVYIRVAAFQAVLALKLVAYGVLAATGCGAWLMVTGALGAAAAAQLLSRGGGRGFETTLAEAWREWGHWIVASLVAVLAGRLAGELLAALLSLVLAWLLSGFLGSLAGAEGRQAGSTGWLGVAEAVSLVVLAIGVLAGLAP